MTNIRLKRNELKVKETELKLEMIKTLKNNTTNTELENEIMDNIWLVSPFKPELLYDVPFHERWKAAGLLLGVNMDQVIPGSGHA